MRRVHGGRLSAPIIEESAMKPRDKKNRSGEDSVTSGNVLEVFVFSWMPRKDAFGIPTNNLNAAGRNLSRCLLDKVQRVRSSSPLSSPRLSECYWLRRQLGQTHGGRRRKLVPLHTDSSVDSSRGLMYSNPSNSDWSIFLMTSLRRGKN